MNSKTTFALILAFLWIPISGMGQEDPQRGNRAGRQGRGQRIGGPGQDGPGAFVPGGAGNLPPNSPIIRALDADGDGVISAIEIQNATKALLSLDRNGDGKLSPEEFRPPAGDGARGGQRGERAGGPASIQSLNNRFAQLDSNRNGKLEGDEIPEGMKRRLDVVDANGDGAVDIGEMEKSQGQAGQRGGRRGMQDLPGESGGAGVVPKRPGQ